MGKSKMVKVRHVDGREQMMPSQTYDMLKGMEYLERSEENNNIMHTHPYAGWVKVATAKVKSVSKEVEALAAKSKSEAISK